MPEDASKSRERRLIYLPRPWTSELQRWQQGPMSHCSDVICRNVCCNVDVFLQVQHADHVVRRDLSVATEFDAIFGFITPPRNGFFLAPPPTEVPRPHWAQSRA